MQSSAESDAEAVLSGVSECTRAVCGQLSPSESKYSITTSPQVCSRWALSSYVTATWRRVRAVALEEVPTIPDESDKTIHFNRSIDWFIF